VLCSLSRLLSSCCKYKQFFPTTIQLEHTAIWNLSNSFLLYTAYLYSSVADPKPHNFEKQIRNLIKSSFLVFKKKYMAQIRIGSGFSIMRRFVPYGTVPYVRTCSKALRYGLSSTLFLKAVIMCAYKIYKKYGKFSASTNLTEYFLQHHVRNRRSASRCCESGSDFSL
jgi:hypothetical protein